jgi:hypothetical protein
VKTQKQLNELREDFNKLQSGIKETIKKKIYEIKKTTQNVKQEFNKDMENLKKKNQIETLEIKSSLNQIKKYRGEFKPQYHHHQKKKKIKKIQGKALLADSNKWKTESQRLKTK